MWIHSFRLSTVVRYYMKYTGLSLGPSTPISFLDILPVASRFESEQKFWELMHF